MEKRRGFWSKALPWAGVVFWLGLASWMIVMSIHAQEEQIQRADAQALDDDVDALRVELELQAQQVRAAQAFWDSSNFVSRDEYFRFTNEILSSVSADGVLSLTYLEFVRPDGIPDFEEKVRNDDLLPSDFRANFSVRALEGQSLEGRPFHVFPYYRSTPYNQTGLIGMDLSSEPIRERLFIDALTDNQIHSSPPLVLLDDGRLGLLLTKSVHDNEGNVEGFILGVYNFQGLLDDVLQDSKTRLLHSGAVLYEGHAFGGEGTISQNLKFAGATYTLERGTGQPAYFLTIAFFGIIGVVLAISSFYFVHVLISRQAKLTALVKVRTAELELKNQELERFASVASHDLRTPLTVIKGFADIMEMQLDDDNELKEYVARIQAEADRMNGLIGSLLAYARTGQKALKFQDVEMDSVMENLRSMFQAKLDELGAKFTIQPGAVVHGDPTLIALLFQNLIQNSLKFAREEPLALEFTHESDEKAIRLKFADNGQGMPENVRLLAFDAINRPDSKRKGEGTGLGLGIVKKICEAHRGTISVESEMGVGTTFTIHCPL